LAIIKEISEDIKGLLMGKCPICSGNIKLDSPKDNAWEVLKSPARYNWTEKNYVCDNCGKLIFRINSIKTKAGWFDNEYSFVLQKIEEP